ncbi:UNVERIFIED_ORG: hypothetical protein EDC93_101943 [Bacillus cereus]
MWQPFFIRKYRIVLFTWKIQNGKIIYKSLYENGEFIAYEM